SRTHRSVKSSKTRSSISSFSSEGKTATSLHVLQVEHNRRSGLLGDIRGNGFDVDVVGVPARRCDNLTRPRVGPVRIPLEAHAELVRNRRKNLLRTGTLRLGERD